MSKAQKWWLFVAVIASIAALICSIISLCNSNERNTEIDYIGVIGAVLGATVTVLVGWQIFSLIKIDGLMQKLESAEERMCSMENKILRKLYSENADISILQVATLLRPNQISEERRILEMRLAYGVAAQTIRNQLRIEKTEYIDLCLQTMVTGILFAESNNNWERIFNQSATKAFNSVYESILEHSAPMTLQQKDTLTRIHDSRISQSVHNALRRQ